MACANFKTPPDPASPTFDDISFVVTPYTEIVGDQQFVRAVFGLGEGEVAIDGMRLGETSLAEYDEVETEIRYGVVGELPLSLCPQQVVEEQIGVELTRP